MSIQVRQPIEKKRLSQSVEEELERIIRCGEIAVGECLPSERHLMDMFGVGRPSIRDALSALSRKGLVKINSGERTRVTRPSASHILSELESMSKDFLSRPNGLKYFDQLRLFFETSLVRYAAEYASEEQLQALAKTLDINEKAIGNTEQFIRSDMQFHMAIAQIPENPIFLAVHQALVEWVISERTPINGEIQTKLDRNSFKAHKKIFSSIQNRDPDAAEKALKEHLEYVFENYYPSK